MADFTNTDSPREPQDQPPTYPSPIPGDHRQVSWPDYLALMAGLVDEIAPDEPGRFVGNYLIGLSKQARLMGCVSPSDHLAADRAAADRADAYVASLEATVDHLGTWALGPESDLDLGDHGGHPRRGLPASLDRATGIRDLPELTREPWRMWYYHILRLDGGA